MRQKVSSTGILSNEPLTYYLLTEEEALAEITKTVKEVNEILNLPSATLVRLILNHFRWDKSTVTGRVSVVFGMNAGRERSSVHSRSIL